jgi:hypothetical protein
VPTTGIQFGSTSWYQAEIVPGTDPPRGMSNEESWDRLTDELALSPDGITLDFYHGYSGNNVSGPSYPALPTSVNNSDALKLARDHGAVDCELSIKTDWELTSGRQSDAFWANRLTLLMTNIDTYAPGWAPNVRFVLNHEPENAPIADPRTNQAAAEAAAGRWRSVVKALAEAVWAYELAAGRSANPKFRPQLTFMGYNSKVRKTTGTRFSGLLHPTFWDPAFTASQKANDIIVTGDIYPKLDASGNIVVRDNDDQAVGAQAKMFDDYHALGYRQFGFSEFCFNTDEPGVNHETKVRDAWRGYDDNGVAVAGSLGDYLRGTNHNIVYFSAFERHFTGPETVAGQNSALHRSMTRMQGFKDLVNDLRVAAPPPTDPTPALPTAPGDYWIEVSDRWDSTLRGSNVIELRVDAYRPPDVNGNRLLVASDLPVDPDSATITMDGESEVRRTVELTISDPTLVPTSAAFSGVDRGSWLTPHGTELHITRGFRYPDGTTEMVPVGVFRIDRPSTPLTGAVRITGVDYSRQLAEDLFVRTAQSASGQTAQALITTLIQDSVLGAEVISTITGTTAARRATWEQGTSRWEAIHELALSIGADVAVRPDGAFVIRKMPVITNAPVWSISIGDTGVLVAGVEDWDRERVYNAIVARGEGGTGAAPVQAIEYDTAAGSPTLWGGPFGRRPKVYSSPLLATVQQCRDAAKTILARTISPSRILDVTCIPNPALDFGDVVEVVLPAAVQGGIARVERHMVWGYTMPLGLGAMDLRLYSSNPGL